MSGLNGGSTEKIAALSSVAHVKDGRVRLSTTKSDELWNVLQAIREAGGEVHEVTKPAAEPAGRVRAHDGEVNE